MVVEAISCFLCSATLFWVVWSGEYLYFVTPKMKYYIYFAVIIFFLWGIYELVAGRKQVYKRKFDSYYLLFAISAFLIISCNHSRVRMFSSPDSIETMVVGSGSRGNTLLNGLDEKEKKVVVTSENFLAWINELRINPHAYNGYAITIEGNMGMKEEKDKRREFYLIRWYMSCCAADVVPVGILCEMEEENTMEEEVFVKVEGTIRCSHTEEGEHAKIIVKEIVRTAEPKEKYIYS